MAVATLPQAERVACFLHHDEAHASAVVGDFGVALKTSNLQ
ncbi:MAG: hypothetical protein JWO71_2920 [Candidatus Acidoferrum typicum]|nr:hypothetical protein [Candidatus Acidoferrum typicum]